MIAGTHIAFAGLCGVIAQGFGIPLDAANMGALVIGSLLPDIDTTSSGLGRFVKPISSLIERRFGHRSITHSILGTVIFGVLAYPLARANMIAWWFLIIGILSHIMLDTLNIIGVPLLYPNRLQFWFVSNRAYRIPYGSPLEATLTTAFALGALACFPLAKEGFTPAFHRFLGTPSGVVSDYLEWRDTHEVFAQVDGFNVETQETIKGKYRVIDALGKEGVIVEDSNGDALAMGLTRNAQVSVYHTHAERGAALQAREYRLELSGRSIADLLGGLPQSRRVYITANLQTTLQVTVPPPAVGHYARVVVFGRTLQIRSARASDLASLETAFIEHGTAVIRIEYLAGEAVSDSVNLAKIKRSRTHVLEIPNLPTVTGLVVKAGDKVLEGQPVARYINDQALEAKRAEVDKARLIINSSSAELVRTRSDYAAILPTLEQQTEDARKVVKREEFLVNAGADPPVKLAEARAKLRDLEAVRLMQLSNFTSKEASLERTINEAKLTVRGAESAQGALLEKQWVRSPMAALVTDVKIKAVTSKGVTLELILLEDASEPAIKASGVKL